MSTDDATQKLPTTPAGAAGTTAALPVHDDSATDPLSGFTDAAPVPAPAGTTTSGEAPARRGVRVGTFVWGLVIVAVGVGVLALSAGYTLDVELALIVLLGAAGAAMLVGSLLKGRRNGGS